MINLATNLATALVAAGAVTSITSSIPEPLYETYVGDIRIVEHSNEKEDINSYAILDPNGAAISFSIKGHPNAALVDLAKSLMETVTGE